MYPKKLAIWLSIAVYFGSLFLISVPIFAQSEDCLPYNPNNLRIEDEGADGWLLTDGVSRMLVLDNETDALAALAVAQRHTQHCFVGRGTARTDRSSYVHEYWQGNSGIETFVEDEDCIPYASSSIFLENIGSDGWLLTDGSMAMVILDTKEDGELLLAHAQENDQQCFIGRNNTRPNRMSYIVEYWVSSNSSTSFQSTTTFNGLWTNLNPETRGITQVEFRMDGETIYVKMWGACSPTDCDWGEESASLADSEDGVFTVVWDHGFSEATQHLALLSDGTLLVNTFTQFMDDSGRSPYATIEYFALTSSSNLPVPTHLSPPNGIVFDHYPRTTTLAWASVPGAASYNVEIDCFHCCANNEWCSDVGSSFDIASVTTTSYSFDFVGAQPGRWRVQAVEANGNVGNWSEWWEFEYTQ